MSNCSIAIVVCSDSGSATSADEDSDAETIDDNWSQVYQTQMLLWMMTSVIQITNNLALQLL